MRGVVLALALTAAPAAAQQVLPAHGSELFRGLLHRANYVPANGQTPQVVVVFGPHPVLSDDITDRCRRTLTNGGSVLVVSSVLPALRECFPTRPDISTAPGSVARLDTRELSAPYPVTVGLIGPARQLRTEDLKLEMPDDVAVELPPRRLTWSRPGDPWVGAAVAEQRDGVLAAAGGTGPRATGRSLVIASDRVFSNAFIAGRFEEDADTGNLQFAANVVRWLRPAGEEPVRCLFVERNRIVNRFDEVNYDAALMPQLPPIGPPPLSAFLEPEAQAKLADAANESFDRVQSDDRFNSALTRGRRYGRTIRWLFGILALLVVVALVRRSRAARKPPDPAPLPRTDVGKPLGSFAQRREELLRAGDHTTAVREYLVELFRQHGLPLDEYRHPKRMPKVHADAATRKRLATLWEAAYGPHPISYTRWKELEPMIEAVRADAAVGRWRFGGGRA